MKLSVMERLLLLQLLPKKADLTDIKIVHQTRMELAFSEEEQKVYKFQNMEGKTVWNSKDEKKKEINFGKRASEIIAQALQELNKKKELTENHIPLYEKFVKNG